MLGRRKRTILILQDESISFPTLRIVTMFNSGFRSLSKFEFECSVIQQRVVVELDYFMPLGVLIWHILGSTTVIMLPCMLTRGGTRLFLGCSHIQHFILASQLQTYQMPIPVVASRFSTVVSESHKGERTQPNRDSIRT